MGIGLWVVYVFFFQAEDGIVDSVASRGLGDVDRRQGEQCRQAARRAVVRRAV